MFNNLIIKVMKKIFILAAVTAIALAACTKTETTGVSEGNLIKFDNAFVGNPTKAGLSEINKDNLTAFYVQGNFSNDPVFENGFETVSKTATGQWVYTNLKEWQPGTWYWGAYSDGNEPVSTPVSASFTVETTQPKLTITDYTLNADTPKDLVVAVSTTDLTTNQPVPFTFNHALSQVKFTLTNGVAESDIKITDFKVSNVKSKATATVTDAISWTASGNETVTLTNSAAMTAAADAAAVSDNFAVIPVDYSADEITVTFTATIDMSEPTEDIVKYLKATIAPANTWEPGYRYNYTAEITGKLMDLIEFTLADVNKWEDNTQNTPISEDDIISSDSQQ